MKIMSNACRAAVAAAGLLAAAPALADDGPVTVIAHVDLLPQFLGQGLPIIEQFAAQSRNDAGTRSVTLITWAPTTNHFQLISVYDTLQSYNAHISNPATVAFRAAIQPYIGALYDERRYYPAGDLDRR